MNPDMTVNYKPISQDTTISAPQREVSSDGIKPSNTAGKATKGKDTQNNAAKLANSRNSVVADVAQQVQRKRQKLNEKIADAIKSNIKSARNKIDSATKSDNALIDAGITAVRMLSFIPAAVTYGAGRLGGFLCTVVGSAAAAIFGGVFGAIGAGISVAKGNTAEEGFKAGLKLGGALPGPTRKVLFTICQFPCLCVSALGVGAMKFSLGKHIEWSTLELGVRNSNKDLAYELKKCFKNDEIDSGYVTRSQTEET